MSGSAEEAVDRAISSGTTTAAREPILQGGWIQPGAHLNVAASIPRAREVDTALVARARLFVDLRE